MGRRRQLQNNSHTARGFSFASEMPLSTVPLPASLDAIGVAGGCFRLAGTQTDLSAWRVPPLIAACTPPLTRARKSNIWAPPGVGSAVQEGRHFNSWTSFCVQIPGILSRRGDVHVDRGALTLVASPKRRFVLEVDFRRAENKHCERRPPCSLLTAVYRFHMMSVKAGLNSHKSDSSTVIFTLLCFCGFS